MADLANDEASFSGSKAAQTKDLTQTTGNGDEKKHGPGESVSLTTTTQAVRPSLTSKPTTAIATTAVQTQTFPDGSRGTYANSEFSPFAGDSTSSTLRSRESSDNGEVGSMLSLAPTIEATGDIQSLLSEVLDNNSHSPAWRMLSASDYEFVDANHEEDKDLEARLAVEFQQNDSEDETKAIDCWKSKLKHFIILSSAGKPIYSRHGHQGLISPYIGVINTLISFFETSREDGDTLRSIVAGSTRFAVLIRGPVYLAAISQLRESETQLQTQLEALYMQILSTLTYPTLEHLFRNRPSTDLRRVLHGTEPLLSGLADTFTRGSPSSLLSALECLKLRKTERTAINYALSKHRSQSLLYGLIVSKGRLVSVVRPKKHSLHPSDLQLIFNMLFEADGIKAAGGENWVPICLPGFNKSGFLYMYVSFLPVSLPKAQREDPVDPKTVDETSIALLLISAEKDSFPDQQKTKNSVLASLTKSKLLSTIYAALPTSRPSVSAILPNMPILHFLYKSRSHVQYVQASHEPFFPNLFARRKLHSLYAELHESVHAKGGGASRKMLHVVNVEHVALAWCVQSYELYLVAKRGTSKQMLAKAAQMILAYVRKEEERMFIIGGAVF